MVQLTQENLNKKPTYQLFIEIVLYLLLAFAFFSNYFVSNSEIRITSPLIFIFGIIAVLLLVLIKDKSIFFSWLSTIPFILIFLFVLTRMYYFSVFNKGMGAGWNFICDFINLIIKIVKLTSFQAIVVIILLMVLIWVCKKGIRNLFKKLNKKKLKKICVILLIIILILILILLNYLFFCCFCK